MSSVPVVTYIIHKITWENMITLFLEGMCLSEGSVCVCVCVVVVVVGVMRTDATILDSPMLIPPNDSDGDLERAAVGVLTGVILGVQPGVPYI